MKERRVTKAKRWALLLQRDANERTHFSDVSEFLLGRYCWDDADENEIPIRTFRTKKLALEAAKKLTSYKGQVKPVRVKLRIEWKAAR